MKLKIKEQKKKFKEFLSTQNLTLTKTRSKIMEFVLLKKSHFDVESLFFEMRNKDLGISRATVYRTIPLLLKAGLIRESIRDHGASHYERNLEESHLHLVCEKCGSIIEIECEEGRELFGNLSQKNGFTLTECRILIKGICKSCKKKEEEDNK